MATRKPSLRNRALRPLAEDLESRQLLSATISGTDVDGDTWTLKLTGPGSLTVVKQNGLDGSPAPINSTTEIDQIIVGGTDPLATRLVGKVHKGPNGDGKVFFNTMNELESRSEKFTYGLGLLGIDMPNFWLGNTTPKTSTATATTPSITIPDGVDTFHFGGVDTFHNQVDPPPSTATSNIYAVNLGLPAYGGTRIIIDRSISGTQQVPSATAGQPATTIQHAVVFAVSGRLNLFQANSVDGDAAHPPGQFSDQNPSASGTGGTIVTSETSGTAPFLSTTPNLTGGLTGQIGTVRVGGNATNFTTVVEDSTGVAGAKINNFSIGGETSNVLVVAPSGLKNAAFGKGMDTTDILAHVVDTIEANRGALNSNVYVDRTISRVHFGGDVINTNILTGFSQSFGTILSNISGVTATGATGQPTGPTAPTDAQIGGGMTALVAGNVTDSVFAASVAPSPNNGAFGSPNQLTLPNGRIAAKVEGTISNFTATPDQPNTAFYAQHVHLTHGPIIPPNVPEPPYPGRNKPIHAPGLHHNLHIQALKGLQTVPSYQRIFTGGVAPPGGPKLPKKK